MCSCRVNPIFVINALQQGADDVFIGGSHHGDCQYDLGKNLAWCRIAILEKLLKYNGIGPKRFRVTCVSAEKRNKFAKVVREVAEDIRKLVPTQHFKRENKC